VISFYLKIITIVNELFDWINHELNSRGWNNSELARSAGLSQSFVSMVLNGQRGVSADFCIAIAKAFNERPETVLRLANILPPSSGALQDLDSEEAELITLYRALKDQRDRESVVIVAQGFLMRQQQQQGE